MRYEICKQLSAGKIYLVGFLESWLNRFFLTSFLAQKRKKVKFNGSLTLVLCNSHSIIVELYVLHFRELTNHLDNLLHRFTKVNQKFIENKRTSIEFLSPPTQMGVYAPAGKLCEKNLIFFNLLTYALKFSSWMSRSSWLDFIYLFFSGTPNGYCSWKFTK